MYVHVYVPRRNINGIVFLYFTAVLWYAFISFHPLTSGDGDGGDDGVDWAHGNATTKWCFAVTDFPFLSLSPLFSTFYILACAVTSISIVLY